jgi:hypothetical protein
MFAKPNLLIGGQPNPEISTVLLLEIPRPIRTAHNTTLTKLASLGQTSTQGGFLQCMQSLGINRRLTTGYDPTSSSSTKLQKIPGSVKFSTLQAMEQV